MDSLDAHARDSLDPAGLWRWAEENLAFSVNRTGDDEKLIITTVTKLPQKLYGLHHNQSLS